MIEIPDIPAAKYELELAFPRLRRLAEAEGRPVRVMVRPSEKSAGDARRYEPDDLTVEVAFGKIVVSWFGNGFAESRRVVKYAVFPASVELTVTRQAGRIVETVTISVGSEIGALHNAEDRRRDFRARFVALLKARFPGAKIERALVTDDSRHAPVSPFVRVWFTHRGVAGVAVGVNPAETQAVVDRILGVGLEEIGETAKRRSVGVERILLVVPRERGRTLAERLSLVATPSVELYEADVESGDDWRRIPPIEQPALVTGPACRYLWPKPEPKPTDDERTELDRVKSVSPACIDLHAPAHGRWFSLRWLGLEFARLSRETALRPPTMSFGLPAMDEPFQKRTEANEAEWNELLARLSRFRTAQSSDRTHPLYRAQAERWLEAVVRRGIDRLDPELNPAFAYAQVPAYGLNEEGYADLLSATRDGRLAVLELKASEDRDLLWQGLDYWRRVRAHARRGDFQRRGFFAGVDVDFSAPPVLYLVAPMLQTHKTLNNSRAHIDPRVPVRVLGVSQHWRENLRVIVREEFRGTRNGQ